MTGDRLIQASWGGTGFYAAAALAAAAGAPHLPAIALALVLFAASIPLFVYALGRGAVRTAQHSEFVTVPGLFFLAGSAPRSVRRSLMGSLAVCLVVTTATAWVEPFGVLVPIWPLAVGGAWAARHGTFPPIPERRR